MSVQRKIFEKTIDELEKIDGTLDMGHDGVADLFMDRFSTVIDRDQSAHREIPSEFYMYEHFDSFPSGEHYDYLYTPDFDGDHMLMYDLNEPSHEEDWEPHYDLDDHWEPYYDHDDHWESHLDFDDHWEPHHDYDDHWEPHYDHEDHWEPYSDHDDHWEPHHEEEDYLT